MRRPDGSLVGGVSGSRAGETLRVEKFSKVLEEIRGVELTVRMRAS
jgi:hypothetical protein